MKGMLLSVESPCLRGSAGSPREGAQVLGRDGVRTCDSRVLRLCGEILCAFTEYNADRGITQDSIP